MSKDDVAREWAHIHWIWREAVSYQPSDVRITLRGKNVGRRPLTYNPVQNEFLVSPVAPMPEVAEAVSELVRSTDVKFVHGYPSAVADFLDFLSAESPSSLLRLSRGLKGVLLGSEYPAPHYRDRIEELLRVPTLSWYGHSECAVLAWEQEEAFSYVPLHTYGLAEIVGTERGSGHLVGTSWTTEGTPFVRYDTGDGVEGRVSEAGLVERFRIVDGREGDFVTDRAGRRVSLTAIIFGRHHPALGKASHVQVRQEDPGRIVLLVVPTQAGIAPYNSVDWLREHFDFEGLDMDVEVEVVSEPVRSRAGKTPLLVGLRKDGS